MIVDINAYCGNWPYWPIKHSSATDLVTLMDRVGIDRAVITSTQGPFVGSPEGNAETVRIVAGQPDRLIGFATASPTDEAAALTDLVRCHESGMRGLRLFPQHHQYRLDDDPILGDILNTVSSWGWPVLIPIRLIMNWGLPSFDVREIGNLAARYPSVNFIISGVNYGELRDSLAVMRRSANVGIETSCLQVHEGVKGLVDRVGSSRVYFGTGLPLQYPAAGMAKVQHAEIDQVSREAILGGNAMRCL
ncbi:MAG: amidohydrolase family protein [Anaerolineae bacterium]|nr:amidohydrolase family protein [Anaerolineae bacterium]